MISRGGTTVLVAALVARAIGGATSLGAQIAGIPDGWASGSISVSQELYGASGIDPRRPGSTWRVQASPSLRLFGATSVGMELLLSNDGAEFSQRLPQLGFEPHFAWGTAHLGDFSHDFGAYTLQGIRLRGAGLEVARGPVRASLQGGTSQSAIATTLDGPVYRRTVYAAAVGVGAPERNSLDITIVRALDALTPDERPFVDTLGLDTLAADLRPQAFNRPQSGLVAAVAGSLALFEQALRVKGEVAGALLTRDRTSPRIIVDSVAGAGIATGLGDDFRLSSSGDLAWNVEGQFRARKLGVTAGMEQVGAGYSSLGVAYLVNDRRAWFAGGDVRLIGDRLQLQGRVQKQKDNLLAQKQFTTLRDIYSASAVGRIGIASLALTGARNMAANDAANDTLLVDNRASVLNAQVSVPWQVASRVIGLMGGVSWQQNQDANPLRAIPAITVHTWNAGVTIPVGVVSVAPSINGVSSAGGGVEAQRNVVAGIRANAKLAEGRGSIGAGWNRSFVAAREVSGATAQLGWTLPGDMRASLVGRMQRYGALGTRPSFRETYLTSSLSRSF